MVFGVADTQPFEVVPFAVLTGKQISDNKGKRIGS